MFLVSVGGKVISSKADEICSASDRVVTAAHEQEHLIVLQHSAEEIQRELSRDIPEDVLIYRLRDEINHDEGTLRGLVESLKCSDDPQRKHYAKMSCRSAELDHDLLPVIARLHDSPLGVQYIEATVWLCDPRFPRVPCPRGSAMTQGDLQIVMATVLDTLSHVPGVTGGDISALQALFVQMGEAWSRRYLAVARMFVVHPVCDISQVLVWPEFTDLTMYSSAVQDAVLLLARRVQAATSPCVAEAMRQLFTVQQFERRFLEAISHDIACPSSASSLSGIVCGVRNLLEGCCVKLRELEPLEERLYHHAGDSHADPSTRQASMLEQSICERKHQMEALRCVVADRRNHLLQQLHELQCAIRKLATEGSCSGNDGPTAMHPRNGPHGDLVVPFAAPCGAKLEISVGLLQPGIEYEWTLTLYAHHEERIAELMCECERLRSLQKTWAVASATLSDTGEEARLALLKSLNEMELSELNRALPAAGTGQLELANQLDASVAQRLVCYWSKVQSNITAQLEMLNKEQTLGVVRDMHNATSVMLENFDYSMQGRYTFVITNLGTGQLIYQSVQCNVLPSASATTSTWKEWSRQYLLRAYEVKVDWRMPHVGAALSSTPAVTSLSHLLKPVHQLEEGELGSHLLMEAKKWQRQDMSAVCERFSGPQQWLQWLSRYGNDRAQTMARRAMSIRGVKAQEIVRLMNARQRRGVVVKRNVPMATPITNHIAVGQVLAEESWKDFFSGNLFDVVAVGDHDAGCCPPPEMSDACGPCPSPENEARWRARLARAVERLMLRETPHFSLFYLSQCDYANLTCMAYSRALSMRWGTEDMAQAAHTGLGPSDSAIEANGILLEHLQRLRQHVHLFNLIGDVHLHGPILAVWYNDVLVQWVRWGKAFAAFDEWLDDVGCHADATLSVDVPAAVDCLRAELEAAALALKTAMDAQTLPRCVYSLEEIQNLGRAIQVTLGAGGDLRTLWAQLVEAHRYVVHFNSNSPWGLVAGTCAPIEWLEVAIVLSKREGGEKVAAALDVLAEKLRTEHMPALANWLLFQLELSLGKDFEHARCLDEVLKGATIQSGIRDDVRSRNRVLDELLHLAYAGEQLATSYCTLMLDDAGPTVVLACEVRAFLPSQPEVIMLREAYEAMDRMYNTQALAIWRVLVRANQSSSTPRDWVTRDMYSYADYWSHNPLDDLLILLRTLEASPLLRVYHPWFQRWSVFNESIRQCLLPAISPDCLPLLNQEILARDFGLCRLTEYPPLPPVEEKTTMSLLMIRYRDLLFQARGGVMRVPSAQYFDLMLRIAILFRTLALETSVQLEAVLNDLVPYKICLPARCFEPTWTEEVRLAVLGNPGLVHDIACQLRTLEMPGSDSAAMFNYVIEEYRLERERLVSRQRHEGEAVAHCHPWLSDDDPDLADIFTPARRRLYDSSLMVYNAHMDLINVHQAVAQCIELYRLLLIWLQTHYVNAVRAERPEVCPLGDGFDMAKHEVAMAHLSCEHLEHHRRWSGTPAERNWCGLGGQMWARAFEIETQLMELVYDSPGNTPDEQSPKEKWDVRQQVLMVNCANWLREKINQLSLNASLRMQLTGVYQQYVVVIDFLKGEWARERLVVPGVQSAKATESELLEQVADHRVVMMWDWLHRDAVTLTNDVDARQMLLASHLELNEAEGLPMIELAFVAGDSESLLERRGLLALVPGVADEGRTLSLELFPMNDVLLSRFFYASLRDDTAPLAAEDPGTFDVEPMGAAYLANVINVLRYHSARRAVRLLSDPEHAGREHIIAGPVKVATGGVDVGGVYTYYDAMSSFVYSQFFLEQHRVQRLLVQHVKGEDGLLTKENVFGADPSDIYANNEHDDGNYSSYVRGNEPRASYTNAKRQQHAAIQEAAMEFSRVVSAEDNLGQVTLTEMWLAQREGLWFLAFTEALENKQFDSARWFFEQWLPSFVALEKQLAWDRPLFANVLRRLSRQPPDPDAITVEHADLLYWMQQSALASAAGGCVEADKLNNAVLLEVLGKRIQEARDQYRQLKVRQAELEAQRLAQDGVNHVPPEAVVMAATSAHDAQNTNGMMETIHVSARIGGVAATLLERYRMALGQPAVY